MQNSLQADAMDKLADDIYKTFVTDDSVKSLFLGAISLIQAQIVAEDMLHTEKNFDVVFKPILKAVRWRANKLYDEDKKQTIN